MSNKQSELQHIKTLERPQWMFWVNRNAAFQALGDMGETASEQVIVTLTNVLCKTKVREQRKREAAIALNRIGPTAAVFVLPRLRQYLMSLDDRSDFIETAIIMLWYINEVGRLAETLGELICQPAQAWQVKMVAAHQLTEIDATPVLPWLLKYIRSLEREEAYSEVEFFSIIPDVFKAIDTMGNAAKSAMPDLVHLIETSSTSKKVNDVKAFAIFRLLKLLPNNITTPWFSYYRKITDNVTMARCCRQKIDDPDLSIEFLKWWNAEGRKQYCGLPSADTTGKAMQTIQESVELPQAQSSGSILLLLLPSGIEAVDIVKAAAKQVGFAGGAVKVMNGPTNITHGGAEALLARIDVSEGTTHLSRPFKLGTGKVSGTSFGYVLVQ